MKFDHLVNQSNKSYKFNACTEPLASTVTRDLIPAAMCCPSAPWAPSGKNKYLVEMPNPLSKTLHALSKKVGWNNGSLALWNPDVTGKKIMCNTAEQLVNSVIKS